MNFMIFICPGEPRTWYTTHSPDVSASVLFSVAYYVFALIVFFFCEIMCNYYLLKLWIHLFYFV